MMGRKVGRRMTVEEVEGADRRVCVAVGKLRWQLERWSRMARGKVVRTAPGKRGRAVEWEEVLVAMERGTKVLGIEVRDCLRWRQMVDRIRRQEQTRTGRTVDDGQERACEAADSGDVGSSDGV